MLDLLIHDQNYQHLRRNSNALKQEAVRFRSIMTY
jgi:hypothetical protein